MSRATGWVPNQHGAWAMLILPFVVGVVLRARAGDLQAYLVPLFAFWMLGYFTFHAVSQWLKAPPKRRPALVRPSVVYAASATVAGLTTLALAGWPILGWAPLYLPLLLPALWLASRRQERATLGGALTVAAASLMTLVARFTSPTELGHPLDDPATAAALAATVGLFAYFFGTVLYVKTNIRERGSRGYLAASVLWHAGATALALAGTLLTGLAWWWPAFFALTTVRAAVVPRLTPAWTPKRIGFLEVGFSSAALLGVLVA